MHSFVSRNRKVLLPIAVLLSSLVVYSALAFIRSAPEVRVSEGRGVLVETVALEKSTQPILIKGNGSVQALRQVSLGAQVMGSVNWVSPSLVSGGFFKKGETLFKIDSEDYLLKVEAAKAEVAHAEQELEVVRANAKIADEEWVIVEKLATPESSNAKTPARSSLQMFKPQLKTAKALLASAKAAAKQAALNLERTEVVAPFNSFVLQKAIELGHYVNVGQTAVELVGTDAVEVIVPVTSSESRWLRRAMEQNRKDSLPAVIETQIDQEVVQWKGFVDRVLADVDTRGRMHRAVVRVANPYFQSDSEEKQLVPLSVGMFTQIEISAGTLKDVFQIPRAAIRANQTVWIADEQNRLRIKEVNIRRGDSEYVYVAEGLRTGDRLILSAISGAVDGLLVRVSESSGSEVS